MKMTNLTTTSVSEITAAFNAAFAKYYVPVNLTEEGMRERIVRGRIDLRESVGVFAEGQLVAFMLTGVEQKGDQKIAYNAGTGVLEAYRRRGLVQQMYDWAEEQWRAAGFTDLCLEVIVENTYAIRAYEKAGFKAERRLASYKYSGDEVAQVPDSLLEQRPEPNWPAYEAIQPFAFSWDYARAGVEALQDDYSFYENWSDGQLQYYAIVHQNGRIAQAACRHHSAVGWQKLLNALQARYQNLIWINIDTRAEALLAELNAQGWEPIIEQYEMFRPLG